MARLNLCAGGFLPFLAKPQPQGVVCSYHRQDTFMSCVDSDPCLQVMLIDTLTSPTHTSHHSEHQVYSAMNVISVPFCVNRDDSPTHQSSLLTYTGTTAQLVNPHTPHSSRTQGQQYSFSIHTLAILILLTPHVHREDSTACHPHTPHSSHTQGRQHATRAAGQCDPGIAHP